MSTAGARSKNNRGNRNDENQSDSNERSDSKEEDRNRNEEGEEEEEDMFDSQENRLDPKNELTVGEQSEAQNKKSASSNGSRRASPVQFEEREQLKKSLDYKPRRYSTRDSLLSRHRELREENKRLLGMPGARNPALAPLLRDEVRLGLLADIPDYYTDEVTVQFLNAQVRSLKEELETLIREVVDKDEMIILLEQRLKETEVERSKLQRETSNKEMHIEKLQKSLDEAKDKCDRLKKELGYVNKEADVLKQGNRQANTIKSNLEAKLARTSEENERIKAELRTIKQSSKEAQEGYQRKMEELSAENRRLDKQNSELHNAIKKQMQLINNLKRQKMHIEAATAVQFSEDEFMKALDRGF